MLVKLVNLSLQGFNIFLVTDSGPKSFWLTPKESVMISENNVSSQIKKMIKKKLLKLERV
jgi:predicted transcriptional regulator